MTDKEILELLRQAPEGEQLPLPNEQVKAKAFELRSLHFPDKQVYLTTQEDYDLWTRRPFGNAPTPGS